MKVCQDKIEFYSQKKRERQTEMINIQKEILGNFDWANSITQQLINSVKTSTDISPPCDISKGKFY